MNDILYTFHSINEAFENDNFDMLPKNILSKIDRALDCWYCSQDFDTVEKITNVAIWNVLEGNKREKALDAARRVWNKNSIELKFSFFTEKEDLNSGQVLARLVKQL